MPIILWFLGPIGRYVLIAAVVAGGFTYVRQHYINLGYKKALTAISAQDQKAKGHADQVHKTVSDCFDAGGDWDVDSGVCVK